MMMVSSRRGSLRALMVVGLIALGAGVPEAKAQLDGIDVSHYQGSINWSSVKASGVVFAFAKATEGSTYTDPNFSTNWPRMKSAGLVRGAYHYGRPGTDAVAQARHFVNVVNPTSGDLQMVLDLETTDGRSPAQVWAWTQAFIAEIKRLTGRPGIIYTGYYFWRDNVGNPSNNLDCPLWIASYNPAPTVPSAWPYWTFWQYTSSGSVPGIAGNVDLDYFNGSLTSLYRLRLP